MALSRNPKTTTFPFKKGERARLRGEAETIAAGERLGRALRSGDAICLTGGIGAGKTTLVKGIAGGLGLRADIGAVASPTFVLIKEYPCRVTLYHADLYRLESLGPVERGYLSECFASDGVTVVEWGEKALGELPAGTHDFEMRHAGASERDLFYKGVLA